MTAHTYIDLFSGCGGLSYGFSKSKDFHCLLASDFWDKAGENYELNHKNEPFELRDFSTQKDIDSIVSRFKNKCDVILGGPPCQGFSTLGKRKLVCEKSILVDSFLETAIRIKPKLILMENVKAITSKKHPAGGLVTDKINKLLFDAGYSYKTIILSATDFGLGQTRKRFFLFAVKKKNTANLNNLIEGINKKKKRKFSNLEQLIGDLPVIEAGQGEQLTEYNGKKIYNHKAMNHSDKLVNRFRHVPAGGGLLDVPKELLTNHLKKMVSGGYGTGGHAKNIYGRMSWDKPSGTIVAGMDKITIGRFVHPESDRLLTPRECARIQSFPDSFKFQGSLVTQYYLIGNAVPPVFSKVFSGTISKLLGGSAWK